MPVNIIVGLQWGDEGKGKIIDILSEKSTCIVRAQGGNNAGHTIKIKDDEFKFHLVPSGILYPHTRCYIAAGVVLDPASLLKEIDLLTSKNIVTKGRLFISSRAHIILPYHIALDAAAEEGFGAIGSTKRGIGPAYSDKALRLGITFGELLNVSLFKERLFHNVNLKNKILKEIYNKIELSFETIYEEYKAYADRLREYIIDVEKELSIAIDKNEDILMEGAQGSLLDINFGSYPFVTSSNTIASGICAGAGISKIDSVTGVFKAYTTRVGNGPFPTEFSEKERKLFPDNVTLREVGTTTGRPRRLGWLDGVLLKYAVKLNNVTSLAIMKLDILDNCEEIKICMKYKLDGKEIDYVPYLADEMQRVEPVYETLKGWMTSTKEARLISQLPENAKIFLHKIESFCGVSLQIVSVGAERDKIIWMNH
jgi:adenylosuccinate synthase